METSTFEVAFECVRIAIPNAGRSQAMLNIFSSSIKQHQVDNRQPLSRVVLFHGEEKQKIFPVCQENIFQAAPNRLKKCVYKYKKLNIVEWIMFQAEADNGIVDGNSF